MPTLASGRLDGMDVSCRKSSVLGLPPVQQHSRCRGHREEASGAMTDGAAGDGEKRAKLQLQVQEQTIAGVLILTHPEALRGARGRIRGQWSYL